MGRYCSYEEVVERYRRLSTSQAKAVDVDSHYIVHAENQLDGLLAPAFAVPFSSTNVTAKDLAIDLTMVRMGTIRDKERQRIKDEVMERVKALVSGEEAMVQSGGDPLFPNLSGRVWSTTQSYHPTMGVSDVLELQVSSLQLEDEEDARD